MILCHLCGALIAPATRQSTLEAAREHAFTEHADHFGDCTFTDVLQRPAVLLTEDA